MIPNTYVIIVVAGNSLRRGAIGFIVGGQNGTHTFPNTASTVLREAFKDGG